MRNSSDLPADRSNALSEVIDNPSIQSLLALNRTDTEEYHKITRSQAEKSFKNAQYAMFFGFFVVLSGALVVLLPTPIEAKVAVATVAAIGGAISGFINRTFQKSHALSLAQLNSFFRQPLVQSYLLTAERVSLHLSEDDQSLVLAQIVNQAIASASSADRVELIAIPTELDCRQLVNSQYCARSEDTRMIVTYSTRSTSSVSADLRQQVFVTVTISVNIKPLHRTRGGRR